MSVADDQDIVFRYLNTGASLCPCGMIETVMSEVLGMLDRIGASWQGCYAPERAELFMAWVLDSWELVTHHGSVDGGVHLTDKGRELADAMARLRDAGEPFLSDDVAP